jgi:hypothetical protein
MARLSRNGQAKSKRGGMRIFLRCPRIPTLSLTSAQSRQQKRDKKDNGFNFSSPLGFSYHLVRDYLNKNSFTRHQTGP